ncbi:Protein cwh43 [Sparassis crispa]|uniref:Protein cwh43 n=1 Tax=Sparassis crispa TaxID=139825 RepID=A0A401H293_9APHY|nr:Protein cwh43 [Sparassis crispa]GBE88480.1 Protein cwh43 [Sparassis crispa]
MASPPKQFVFKASAIARIHTCLAFAAFLGALFLGCALHYKKIVKNGVAGYPDEWFPSVSATIGDWFPERNVFQILIALNSGPRFAVVLLQYYLHRTEESRLPAVAMVVGLLRTLACGGWVYITSNDDHDAHDILMISYIVCNIPWMSICTACTPPQSVQARRRRRNTASAFFISMIPMIYFFIQHKVHRIPGAYTRYSFFEWGLIFFDIMYDSAVELDLKAANLEVVVLTPSRSDGVDDMKHVLNPNVTAVTRVRTPSPVPFIPVSPEKNPSEPARPLDMKKPAKPPSRVRASLVQSSVIIDFLSDLYLSFVYWSILTSLTPTLFYFSVWELSLTGSELSLLSTLSPLLLVIPSSLRWSASLVGRTILHSLSLIGLGAYALGDPLHRLFAVMFATAVSNVGAAADWFGRDNSQVGHQGLLLGLGFMLSSLAKHANHSVNPVWPIVHEQSGGYNKTGIFLACLAIYNFYTRRTTSSPVTSSTRHTSYTGDWLLSGLALGSLIFTLHYLLGDSATLIAWSWTGYPIQGPVPNLHGSLTHVAQALGLGIPVVLSLLSDRGPEILTHPVWFAYGSVSAYVMYKFKDWLGFAGGLNFAIFLMSIIPTVLQHAVYTQKVVKTCATAWLLVCAFYFSSVFTVAYAFVPGGEYFRERTDLVLFAQVVGLAFVFRWPHVLPPVPTFTLSGRTRSSVGSSLAVITITSLLVTMYRWPFVVPKPHRAGARIVRAGIWTVHFGIDNEGRDSQRRMGDLIKDMELDVVGLLETDLHRTVFGNRDLTLLITEELGYFVDIGPGPNSHTWGAVLLSKFPIINSTHHLLPSPHGELAPAIEAVLDVYGTEVTVLIAHNGQEETPLDRELQSKELAQIMAKSFPRPVIFLGYVVTKPLAPRPAPYEIMVIDGKVNDIDRHDWDRWCEYIFYRGLYRTAYARVSRSTITDTELQIGQFVVPKHGFFVTNDTDEAQYLRAWKEELPEDHWLPMAYYPEQGGKRGHFYHVFNTPLYYKIPEGAVL